MKSLATKKSGLPKGVYYTRSEKKFHVRVYRSGRVKSLGVYNTVEEASKAYEQFNIDYPHAPFGPKPFKRKQHADFTGTWLNGL